MQQLHLLPSPSSIVCLLTSKSPGCSSSHPWLPPRAALQPLIVCCTPQWCLSAYPSMQLRSPWSPAARHCCTMRSPASTVAGCSCPAPTAALSNVPRVLSLGLLHLKLLSGFISPHCPVNCSWSLAARHRCTWAATAQSLPSDVTQRVLQPIANALELPDWHNQS